VLHPALPQAKPSWTLIARVRSLARAKARAASAIGTVSVSSGRTSIAPEAMQSTAVPNS
jgi:hypothetical protein